MNEKVKLYGCACEPVTGKFGYRYICVGKIGGHGMEEVDMFKIDREIGWR